MPIYTTSGRRSFIPDFYKRISFIKKVSKDSPSCNKNSGYDPSFEARKSSPYPYRGESRKTNAQSHSNHALSRLQSFTAALISKGKSSFRKRQNKLLYQTKQANDSTKKDSDLRKTVKVSEKDLKTKIGKYKIGTRKSEFHHRSLSEPVVVNRCSLNLPRSSTTFRKKSEEKNDENDLVFLCQLLLIRTITPQLEDKDDNVSETFDHNLDQRYFEYYPTIFKYLLAREKLIKFNNNYLSVNNFTSSFRCILMDWLIKVQQYSKIKTESLQVAVTLIDMFTSVSLIRKSFYQLVGVAGLLIASKVVQRFHPRIKNLCFLTDNCYQPHHIQQMEFIMLEKLDFFVHVPIPSNFHHRALLACVEIVDTDKLDIFCTFMFDLVILDPDSPGLKPSCKAAGAVLIGRYILYPEYPCWTKVLEHYTLYSMDQLRLCVLMYGTMLTNMYANEGYPYKTVLQKYSGPVFRRISKEEKVVEFGKSKDVRTRLEELFTRPMEEGINAFF